MIALIYFLFYLIFVIIFSIHGIQPLKINISFFISNNKKEKMAGNIYSHKTSMNINKNQKSKNNYQKSKQIKNVKDLKKDNKEKGKQKLKLNSNSNNNIKKIKNKKSSFPVKRKDNSNKNLHKKNNDDKNKKKTQKSYDKLDSNSRDNSRQILTLKHKLNRIEAKNNKDINIHKKKNLNYTKENNLFLNKNVEKAEKLSNFELNELDYYEAIKLDKRKFHIMYWSILRREHIILFTFFSWNDYNILYVKFAKFIFLICQDLAMNVVFFSDESMHKLYLTYGEYNFIQQIPQTIYSTIVSQIIEV